MTAASAFADARPVGPAINEEQTRLVIRAGDRVEELHAQYAKAVHDWRRARGVQVTPAFAEVQRLVLAIDVAEAELDRAQAGGPVAVHPFGPRRRSTGGCL